MCGENWRATASGSRAPGSSPRVRGKPGDQGLRLPRKVAHPRVCGENTATRRGQWRPTGSSPRVRGKQLELALDGVAGRLIPACAGKTRSCARRPRLSSAHPRVCGENGSPTIRAWDYAGSSPRVRGKRLRETARAHPGGLIPACAGKTRTWAARGRAPRAHPRVCGENRREIVPGPAHDGSSPRVRGKRAGCGGDVGAQRLIPACAGKTCPTTSDSTRASAHPRVCGENADSAKVVGVAGGSSPRVRGKLSERRLLLQERRLIPACAGKT